MAINDGNRSAQQYRLGYRAKMEIRVAMPIQSG